MGFKGASFKSVARSVAVARVLRALLVVLYYLVPVFCASELILSCLIGSADAAER